MQGRCFIRVAVPLCIPLIPVSLQPFYFAEAAPVLSLAEQGLPSELRRGKPLQLTDICHQRQTTETSHCIDQKLCICPLSGTFQAHVTGAPDQASCTSSCSVRHCQGPVAAQVAKCGTCASTLWLSVERIAAECVFSLHFC